ncbi:hypothetical protein J6590_006142 [Homalodisca vitripennis]|nr:hypothetical protein J6590_006142 [Homalodisca vitripennis]
MSDIESESGQPRRKQGKINKNLHSRDMEKLGRRRDEEFLTKESLLVEARKTGPYCDCLMVCMANVSIEHREYILNNINNGRPKNEQDTYLIELIDRFNVARHRPKTENSKQAGSSFRYFAMKGNERFPGWRKAFISLRAISNKAVSRLTHLKESNKTPEDGRGKHFNRANVKSQIVLTSIHEHISSFLTKVTHYTPMPVHYLDSELTVTDACGEQIRNHTLSRLLLTLTMSDRFETMNQYYPIRGHSFMLCDKTFGVMKRAVKKHDRMYSPEQYKVIICNAKNKYPGYEVVEVQDEDILNFKKWWPHYFKKTSISTDSNKQAFTISKYRNIVYSILNYIPDEYRQFYTERLAWPTSNDTDNDDLYD